MSNIKISDLQVNESELVELSSLDSEAIIGGGWFNDLTGWHTPSFLKKIDDVVHKNGGWLKVIGTIYKGYKAIAE
jgi:hypothetical protein